MGALLQELFQWNLYKRSQGRITRQVTFAAIALAIAFGSMQLNDVLTGRGWTAGWGGVEYWLPGLILIVGIWLTYRLVNYPVFADFLIAVEAEMGKVSWPTRTELVRASIVVLIMLFLLSFVLFGFDQIWFNLFNRLGLYN
ncbi:MAG: preprotein translocase subunit SecE [Planctomycetota bacterium]